MEVRSVGELAFDGLDGVHQLVAPADADDLPARLSHADVPGRARCGSMAVQLSRGGGLKICGLGAGTAGGRRGEFRELLERREKTLENGVRMTTEDAPRRGRGRPSRAEASRKALADVDLRHTPRLRTFSSVFHPLFSFRLFANEFVQIRRRFVYGASGLE